MALASVPTEGEIRLSGWHVNDIALARTDDVNVQRSFDGDGVSIKLNAANAPPDQIRLAMKWPNSRYDVQVSLPFPATGGRVYDVDGNSIESGQTLALRRLAGTRVQIFDQNPDTPKRYEIALSLLGSLETMGLVRTTYPKLDAVVRVPDFPPGLPAFSLSDWKDFLKIALDFHVRENTFIDLPDSWRKWGGNRLSAKQLLPPDSKELQTNKLKRWPQSNPAGRQSRLVRLLAYVCKLDAESSYGKEIIDCILRSAWDQLIAVGLLQPGGIGR